MQALGPLVALNWYAPLRPVADNSLYDAWASSLMYKGLVTMGANAQIDFARSIASAITWNSAGTVYTVTMNPKWHWSNGTPVTSADVAFTWQLLQGGAAPTAPAPWPYAGATSGGVPQLVSSFTVLSPYRFQITLKKPVNQFWFEYNGLPDFTPMPKASWDRYPTNINAELAYLGANGAKPSFFSVVDGPFKLASVVPNSAWTFTPNAAYDGHKPYVSRFILAYQTSQTSEVAALKTSAVQVGYLPMAMYPTRAQLTNDTLVKTTGFSMDRTILNFANPQVGSILKQTAVRQALQMGVDQKGIIKALYYGLGIPGTGPVPQTPSTFLAPQLHKPLQTFDPAAGKALLEHNGWHMAGGVMTNASGQKLEFSMQYDAGSSTTLAMAQIMQRDWAQEGIQVSLTSVPFAGMLQYHRQPTKWQMQTGLGISFGGSYPTGGALYKSTSPTNFYHYSSATMNSLIAATHSPAPTAAASQKALDNYQLFAAKSLPNLWMPLPVGLEEIAKNVHGVRRSTNSFTNSISPQYWWVG